MALNAAEPFNDLIKPPHRLKHFRNIMLSYHSDPSIKSRYLARVAGHADADEIVKGRYWENGKGCAVGCTIHGEAHESFERELGIPQMLAWLEDVIFEGLPNRLAKTWPERFLSSITPGRDLSPVGWQFLHWLLTESGLSEFDHVLINITVMRCAVHADATDRGEIGRCRRGRTRRESGEGRSWFDHTDGWTTRRCGLECRECGDGGGERRLKQDEPCGKRGACGYRHQRRNRRK